MPFKIYYLYNIFTSHIAFTQVSIFLKKIHICIHIFHPGSLCTKNSLFYFTEQFLLLLLFRSSYLSFSFKNITNSFYEWGMIRTVARKKYSVFRFVYNKYILYIQRLFVVSVFIISFFFFSRLFTNLVCYETSVHIVSFAYSFKLLRLPLGLRKYLNYSGLHLSFSGWTVHFVYQYSARTCYCWQIKSNEPSSFRFSIQQQYCR